VKRNGLARPEDDPPASLDIAADGPEPASGVERVDAELAPKGLFALAVLARVTRRTARQAETVRRLQPHSAIRVVADVHRLTPALGSAGDANADIADEGEVGGGATRVDARLRFDDRAGDAWGWTRHHPGSDRS
jgi:hypothetical protein